MKGSGFCSNCKGSYISALNMEMSYKCKHVKHLKQKKMR
jgi:predicted nucleic acid-binding Zn finger protein